MQRFRLLPLALAALLFFAGTAYAQQASVMDSGNPSQLQHGESTSSVPSETPMRGNTSSGQGTQFSVPTYEPLYSPDRRLGDARSLTGAPAWAPRTLAMTRHDYPPFGANLFQGRFAGTFYDGINENYILMPGDRILVQIWGAHAYNDTLMVDQQGNIFLPEVGPVQVAGTRNGGLQALVRRHLAATFKTNMEVYVNLLTAQPVAVYVTGFVASPGRYAGGMSDTVLYYLDRAGGILPDRGSYRDVVVMRNNRAVAHMDLYAFLLTGSMAGGDLEDGDVIVVGPKGGSVLAGGLIPEQASYESKAAGFHGAELMRLASPLPAASHVSVIGTRGAQPFNVYMPLAEFAGFTLNADDRVEFLADRVGETIMVTVSGSVFGVTRYPVKRATTLRSLLAHVPVDATLSNLSGIYLKRQSVVLQQKKAIDDALQRLERSVLVASSFNQESAAIRVQEAKLVQDFVVRVSQLTPDGVVVITRNGVTSDIILEDGDEIVIPQQSDIVQISGEVVLIKAVVFEEGAGVKYYVDNAGGFTARADRGKVLVVHANGEIAEASNSSILPGDMLLVMPRYETKGFTILKDIVQILYQVAIATKVVVDL